jgi:hypothetical protein
LCAHQFFLAISPPPGDKLFCRVLYCLRPVVAVGYRLAEGAFMRLFVAVALSTTLGSALTRSLCPRRRSENERQDM